MNPDFATNHLFLSYILLARVSHTVSSYQHLCLIFATDQHVYLLQLICTGSHVYYSRTRSPAMSATVATEQ